MRVRAFGRYVDPARLPRLRPFHADSYRADGWENGSTGFGTQADKTRHGMFFPTLRVMDRELRDMRDGSDLVAKFVEDGPNEMFREPYKLTGRIRKPKKSGTPTDAADEVKESDVNEMREWVEEQFALDDTIHQTVTEGRYWGGALDIMGFDDGGFPWEPLNEDRIRDCRFISMIDRRYAYPQSQYATIAAPRGKYGTTEVYLIANAIAGSGWDDERNPRKKTSGELLGEGAQIQLVHESRVLRFDGNPADLQSRQRLAGWSWSILQRLYQAMRQFEHSFDSTSYLLSDGSQGVLKLMGLVRAISAGQRQAISDRAMMFEQMRSNMRAIILDAGDKEGKGAESFERQPLQVGGVADILDRMMMRLSAAHPERMPVSLLFGRSPQGLNATGEADIRIYYDACRAYANKRIAPKFKRAYRLLALCQSSPMKGKAVDWSVIFPPLWAPTDKEVQDALLVRAQRDVALTDGGIIPEEDAALTWKDEYPTLDVEGIEKAKKGSVSFDPHEKDEPDPNAGIGEPIGAGAPVPVLGPSKSPEAGGSKPGVTSKMPAPGAKKPAAPKKPTPKA